MSYLSATVQRLRVFCRWHPVLLDSARWALPALLFGIFLRVLLTCYLPYAYWNADSRSFYTFTHKFFLHGAFSLGDKRRYLYPLLMLPVSYLPGPPLKWIAFFQHVFGIVSLLPLAYVVRRSLVYWRVWLILVTVVYTGLPLVLWCEHELLGDCLFFHLLIWTFAGWAAWVSQSDPLRSRRMFWAFFIPLTLFIITKPHGRFVWPGLVIGLCLVKAWRVLQWPQVVALLLLLVVTPTVGSRKQGAWLFYDAAFPLTRLDTPLHADYKVAIRERVQRFRNQLDIYHAQQEQEPYYFLRDPGRRSDDPLWKALDNNPALKDRIYGGLALEAVTARPDLFLYMGLQKVAFDANISIYDLDHFDDGTFIDRTREYYQEALEDEESPVRIAYGLPSKGPIPSYKDFQSRLEPAPGSWPARCVRAIVGAYGTKLDLLRYTDPPGAPHRLSFVRPTFLGCWFLFAIPLALIAPYRRTLGVWMILSILYVFGVYLISVVNVHYIAPVWPIVFVLFAVPGDFLLAKLLPRRVESKVNAA